MNLLEVWLLLIYSIFAFAMLAAIVQDFNPITFAAHFAAVICALLWPVTIVIVLLIILLKGRK